MITCITYMLELYLAIIVMVGVKTITSSTMRCVDCMILSFAFCISATILTPFFYFLGNTKTYYKIL